jgi:hypothetical protein
MSGQQQQQCATMHVLIALFCARWLVYRVVGADTAIGRHELVLQVRFKRCTVSRMTIGSARADLHEPHRNRKIPLGRQSLLADGNCIEAPVLAVIPCTIYSF